MWTRIRESPTPVPDDGHGRRRATGATSRGPWAPFHVLGPGRRIHRESSSGFSQGGAGSVEARLNFSRGDDVQFGLPVRRNQASASQRLPQIRGGPPSRDCASPSTNGQGMTPDSRHCADTVRASRGPFYCLTRPSAARFDCLRVCPSTLAPKGREPVCARVLEVRPNAHTHTVPPSSSCHAVRVSRRTPLLGTPP